MTHDHVHHGHDHPPAAGDGDEGEYPLVVEALRELLIEKGVLTADEVRRQVEKMESPGRHLGARLVARAWVDPEFKKRLLADGKKAAAELGVTVGEAQLMVVENTPTVHNMIVCTLCSCYPRSVLGQPPSWYVSKAYRARAVREPRQVLAEMGLQVAAGASVRVHDSTADLRYLVLPMRPAGSEGLGEEELADLVTRDSMIGTALPRRPGDPPDPEA